MHWIDWTIVGIFLVGMILVGVYFSKKAGENVDSFFVSGRSLKWYVAGASMIATSFAADTPLWVGALIRQYGIHAAWQYWAPLIGSALGVVLFARMWRRSGVVTDNEILELRYSGNSASFLRGLSAGVGALVLCPLIIGWVVKAMVTISQEALGLSEVSDFMIGGYGLSPELLVTMIVMLCAIILCAFSGLYGVVYTDFVQFIIATIGAFLLAWLAVAEVGGLSAMYEKLSTHETWKGTALNLAPSATTKMGDANTTGAMSIWNVIGYFGILWWGVALSGGYQAQRILASKDTRNASQAMLMHTVVYYAIVSLPWIIVALASVLVFPDMGEAGDDAAYPRMILKIMPIGLCGILISSMIAAFISTMSTLFNWGSSYIVNDLYRRFMVTKASESHYVTVSRILTVLVAIAGATISFMAENIQELLEIFFVVGGGAAVVGVTRWLWWRITAVGELVAFVMNYVFAILMFSHKFKLFGYKLFPWEDPLFDDFMASILAIPEGMSFTIDHDFLGARMLFMTIVGLASVVIASLLSKPTEIERLKEFMQRTKIYHPGWEHVTSQIPGYRTAHPAWSILIDWILVASTVIVLLFAMNSIILVQPQLTGTLFAAFAALLFLSIYRIRKGTEMDAAAEKIEAEKIEAEKEES